MAGRLYRMAKVVSANPASWGIVDANQISGFRTVATKADLYSIAACILSSSYGDGTTNGNDAVGQIWHVQEGNGKDYRLTSWANRGTSAGWEEVLYADSVYSKSEIDGKISTINKNINTVGNAADAASVAANAAQTTADAAKSQATKNATAIAGKADKATVDTLGQTVAGHTTSIGTINNTLKNKADSNTVSTLTDTVESIATDLTNFKALKEQANGLATLDGNKHIPLEQLGNLDTTLFEVVPELPSTIATIKKHIYLKTAETTGTKNNYAEYIYTGDLTSTATYDATKWEKLGEVTASVDLSGYYTKSEIDKKVTAINKNSISSLSIGKQDSTDAVSVVLKRAGGENTLSAPIPVVNNDSDNHHNGLMSPAMLTKLNGIAEGANKYTHPTHTAHTSGLYKITVDGLGHISATDNVEAEDLKAAGALTSAPTFGLGSTVYPGKITINASYNGENYPVDIAEADSNHPGLISPALYNKLTGIIVKDTVTSTGTDAVSGKAVWNHVYNYKIHGDNIGNEVNGQLYTIVARCDDDNTVTCLTDVLTLNYDATNHSNLVVDDAVVWDGDNLKAITNDELTKILV